MTPAQDPHAVAAEVIGLLRGSGGEQYFGEEVSKLEHALQCAWHAARACADEELILAALLHDIGHLFDTRIHRPPPALAW
ncbi:MAG: HD domain-containing protein [Bryobacteraceae bacterium]